MRRTTDSRVENLERVALEFEGAHFATRHLLAILLSRLDQDEAEECLRDAISIGQESGGELGERRLYGYLTELNEIGISALLAKGRQAQGLKTVRSEEKRQC